MNSKEKIAYLSGLIAGSDIEFGKKEQKVANAVMDTLTTIADEIVATNERIDEIDDSLGHLFTTLELISHTMMHALRLDGVDEDLFGDDDSGLYEIECPNCDELLLIDEEDLDEGSVVCYECGQIISLEDIFDDDEDDED